MDMFSVEDPNTLCHYQIETNNAKGIKIWAIHKQGMHRYNFLRKNEISFLIPSKLIGSTTKFGRLLS